MSSAIGTTVPQAVLNAAIIAAQREHPQQTGDRADWPWADMLPVVTASETYAEPNRWGDSWWVEVQYSTRGYKATYGVNRNHVTQCYAD